MVSFYIFNKARLQKNTDTEFRIGVWVVLFVV